VRFNKAAVILVTGLAVVGLTACSGEAAPTPTATPTPVAASGDGILRIGDLTPTTGDMAAFGNSQAAGVELAVREINDAGGYNKVPVEVLHRNAGDGDAAITEASFNDLLSRGVDVIIAPDSKTVTKTLQDLVTKNESNVAIISIATGKNATKEGTVTVLKPDDAFVARLQSSDPSLTEVGYGAEAYDSTIASALAATVAQDDGGASVVQGLVSVSSHGGITCTSYGMCLDVLVKKPSIDYVGIAGQMNYDSKTGVTYFTKK
jgi:hypothetical protein